MRGIHLQKRRSGERINVTNQETFEDDHRRLGGKKDLPALKLVVWHEKDVHSMDRMLSRTTLLGAGGGRMMLHKEGKDRWFFYPSLRNKAAIDCVLHSLAQYRHCIGKCLPSFTIKVLPFNQKDSPLSLAAASSSCFAQ